MRESGALAHPPFFLLHFDLVRLERLLPGPPVLRGLGEGWAEALSLPSLRGPVTEGHPGHFRGGVETVCFGLAG